VVRRLSFVRTAAIPVTRTWGAVVTLNVRKGELAMTKRVRVVVKFTNGETATAVLYVPEGQEVEAVYTDIEKKVDKGDSWVDDWFSE
jgi:hypothetical protein